jgi:predicted acylesterase/phospholipase RssA/CRP-like cAMP-binding protein
MPSGVDAQTTLFEGLDAPAMENISRRMRQRHFAARAVICRQGEPGDSLFVIRSGLAQVIDEAGGARTVARLRRGEVVGEMSLVTGEARSATVVANVPTEVLELDQRSFTALLAEYPLILANLSRILSRRLARKNKLADAERRRGEAVALVIEPSTAHIAGAIVEAARATSQRQIRVVDMTRSLPSAAHDSDPLSAEDVLGGLDDLLVTHGTVIVAVDAGRRDELALLLEHMDRVLAVATAPVAKSFGALIGSLAERVEIALVRTDSSPPASSLGMRVVRTIRLESPERDVAWLGRHLARTKIGLALGAGGAKGYAHVGALQVLESAGYTIDYVSGSSIGAMVGSWLALGRDGRTIDSLMRSVFSPENVAQMFKISFSGMSTGFEMHVRLCRETTEEHSFSDVQIPFVAMAVDLDSRQPAPIRDGPLWEALVASTAVAGLFPPFLRDGHRLVDGITLVPVPTDTLVDSGADLTVSVNLMSRDTLPAWPGDHTPAAPSRSGSRMLDTLLEVIDLAQLEASVRHAARADVVMTPRFGPGNWRDFHLADLFLEAGRRAAEQQLGSLRALARPTPLQL